MFVDWRGDPDERMTAEAGSEVTKVLCEAASRGVHVYGLIWRSHLDKFQFSAAENRHLGELIEEAGGCCLLDMRVRTGGSHHQKFVVLRYRDRPELDVAFLGGIDLCHSRRDDAAHAGDPQSQPMAAVYGTTPPWHDIQLAIHGPAVADVETVFRERWNDPQPLSRSPIRRVADRIRGDDEGNRVLPPQAPPPAAAGPHSVQLLRTYARRLGGYPFAPKGERSVARGYLKALTQARRLIYIEDQYLWSRDVASWIADALRANSELYLIAVLPLHPDQDGLAMPPNLIGREAALSLLRAAAPDRVGIYGIENRDGVPIYVHAKVCIIDDVWVTTGSDNFNRRSWTHDSELSAAVWDDTPATHPTRALTARRADGASADQPRDYPRALRLTLAAEHLGLGETDAGPELTEPAAAFAAFADSAAALQRWYDSGKHEPRPPGQLRPLPPHPLPATTRLWATPLYRALYDPDGRTLPARLRNRY
ncbi:MAG: Phosphatidylserine/phosphatidylglycerophosphate/cardiolipinsynthase-like protein [Jatrophihabitans sp.]|nr:Phosphatidylserine/phosphatidylglycerophosphate/cardiolipinsynthase-like protein [Jatrophihabitans sp.]